MEREDLTARNSLLICGISMWDGGDEPKLNSHINFLVAWNSPVASSSVKVGTGDVSIDFLNKFRRSISVM